MQKNRVAPLAGILVLLLGVAYLAGVFESQPTTIQVPEVEVPSNEVTGLTIESSGWSASLARSGGVWRLTEPVSSAADSNTVKRLLDSIGDLDLATVVSSNPDRHARYGLDPESAQRVTLQWATGELALAVALQGPDVSSSYVRLGENQEVYSGSRVSLPNTLDQLRDKTMLQLVPALVGSVQVTTPESSYQLDYTGGWTISSNDGPAVPADSVRIVSWLRRFSPLRLDGFLDDETPQSVNVTHSILFGNLDGSMTSVSIEERDDQLAVFSSQGSVVMRAGKVRLSSLFETEEALTATQ
jgi:Domain of unknown function (DUF4340)